MNEDNNNPREEAVDPAESRRHFIKCSGGATAATMVAWQLMSSTARAGGGGGGSGGSGGSAYGPIVIGLLSSGGSGGSGGS